MKGDSHYSSSVSKLNVKAKGRKYYLSLGMLGNQGKHENTVQRVGKSPGTAICAAPRRDYYPANSPRQPVPTVKSGQKHLAETVLLYILFPQGAWSRPCLTGEMAMENQHSFSHGLLYSVAPENFSRLHLHDEDGTNEFDWESNEPKSAIKSLVSRLLNFLKSGNS